MSAEKELEKDYKRFMKIMKTPMINISRSDLEWAYRQDRFNSVASKRIFEVEIENRKDNE